MIYKAELMKILNVKMMKKMLMLMLMKMLNVKGMKGAAKPGRLQDMGVALSWPLQPNWAWS